MVKISEGLLARFKGQAVKSDAPAQKAMPITRHLPVDQDKAEKAEPKKPRKTGRDRAAVIGSDREKMEFFIDLPYDPKPKKRPRTMLNQKVIQSAFHEARGNFGAFMTKLRDPQTNKSRAQVTITPKDTVDYENLISEHVRKAIGASLPFEGPVKAELLFVLKGSETLWPTSPADGDADNLEKAAADALNDIAFKDDRFIVITTRYKICRGSPGLLIWLSPAQPEDLEHPMVRAWDARIADQERS